MELIENLPFGLAACRLNDEQVTISAISDRALRLRLSEAVEPRALRLYFLEFRQARWKEMSPAVWRMTECSAGRYGFEAFFEIDDVAYRAEVFRILREYAEYIRLKSDGDDETLACELTGAPCGGEASETFDAQKRTWFSRLRGEDPGRDFELALSLDRPDVYARFLEMPFPEFQRDFFRRGHLDAHALFARKADRVYIGSAFCFRLLPESPAALLERCEAQDLRATVVLPPVRESRRADLDTLLKILSESPADEIAANDWGTLTLLRETGKAVLLGTQLNRRRKDPRIEQKLGFRRDAALLSENCLNDPLFIERLRALNVRRFEYEACIAPVTVAPGRHSLHLPFFQTNTSHACPLAAAFEGTDPGLPRDDRNCSMPCLSTALLYPDRMNMVGRYNSLFSLDTRILSDTDVLRRWLDSGVDRIVAELL